MDENAGRSQFLTLGDLARRGESYPRMDSNDETLSALCAHFLGDLLRELCAAGGGANTRSHTGCYWAAFS